MQKITSAQIRKIHALANQAGVDDDLLHCHLKDVTGKSSLKELTIHEAIILIDSMEGKQSIPERDAATQKQLYYIKDLAKKLGWTTEDGKADMDRVNGMCKQCAKVDSHKWLTKIGASNVIEAMKAMLYRKPV